VASGSVGGFPAGIGSTLKEVLLSWQRLMCDPKLYLLLGRYDEDQAAEIRAAGCRLCAGVLHLAAYPRKPRGGPAELGDAGDRRCSFCCAEEGCRTRHTPQSLRFLGRKVYLGVVVVLVWYLRWKDEAGRWRARACGARTKAEARQLQAQLERKAERVRFGVEAAIPEDGGGTLAELLGWWLDTYSKVLASHVTNESAIRVHFLGSDLASLPLTAVTPGRIEVFLQAKSSEVSPQMVNHLRGYLSRAVNAARRAGRYPGPSPVQDVRKRKVPKRKPDFLRVHEVPLL
jgi:hypothetical protein